MELNNKQIYICEQCGEEYYEDQMNDKKEVCDNCNKKLKNYENNKI